MNEATRTLLDVIELAEAEGFEVVRWKGSAAFYLANKETGEAFWGNRGTTLSDLTVFLTLPTAD